MKVIIVKEVMTCDVSPLVMFITQLTKQADFYHTINLVLAGANPSAGALAANNAPCQL